MMDQLKSGRVDAVEPLEPFVGQMLGAGFKSIGDPLLAVADPVLFPFWIADADWARANRDVLKRWVASLQGGLARDPEPTRPRRARCWQAIRVCRTPSSPASRCRITTSGSRRRSSMSGAM